MGRSIYVVSSLLPPLTRLQEHCVTIPPDQVLRVRKTLEPRVIFFLEGNLELTLPDGTTQRIHQGDAVSFSDYMDVSYRATIAGAEGRIHTLMIRYDARMVWPRTAGRKPPRPAELERFIRLIRNSLSGYHYFPGALDQANGREILAVIRREAKENPSPWIISGLSLALLASLLEKSPDAARKPAAPLSRGEAAVEHAKQFIRDHSHQKLTLSDIAWNLQLSGEHLERLFKRHVGCSVFKYLDRVRIENAKQDLLATELPIFGIAARCGYTSSTLFGRHFKAETGMTPMQFRLRAQQHEEFVPSDLHSE